MSWIAQTFEEFGRSIGLPGLRPSEGGLLSLRPLEGMMSRLKFPGDVPKSIMTGRSSRSCRAAGPALPNPCSATSIR